MEAQEYFFHISGTAPVQGGMSTIDASGIWKPLPAQSTVAKLYDELKASLIDSIDKRATRTGDVCITSFTLVPNNP